MWVLPKSDLPSIKVLTRGACIDFGKSSEGPQKAEHPPPLRDDEATWPQSWEAESSRDWKTCPSLKKSSEFW